MKRSKAFLFLLPLVMFFGCTASTPPAPQKTVSSPKKTIQFPAWYYNPDMSGKTGAVGIAKVQRKGKEAQEKVALLQARAELAKRIAVKISNELAIATQCDDAICRREITSMSQQEASQYLHHTVIKDRWLHPDDHSLYLWIVIDKDIAY